jgi:hypothetical protein
MALALGLLCSPIWAGSAFADRRAYQNAPVLPYPVRDAKAIADKFKAAGYEVVTATDVGNLEFKRAIRLFEEAASNADVAVVYYAGHGIQINGTNYLVPVDAKLKSDRDADDEAVTADRFLMAIDEAKVFRMVILDACRDNPFARTMRKERTAALRGISAGLGVLKPSNNSNMMIAYAAEAGQSAEDGDGDHSPFARALMDDLFGAGRDIRLAFGQVRDDVKKATDGRQVPYMYGSLGAEIVALVPAPAVVAAPVQPAGALNGAVELADYKRIEELSSSLPVERKIRAWQVYLKQYPNGFYSDLAQLQLDSLNAHASAPGGTPQMTLTALEPPKRPTPPGPSTEEQQAWDKIKDSSKESDFRDFIKKYPTSVLANRAQDHIDAFERVTQEKAAREQAAREAAAEAQRQADAKRKGDEAARQKVEQEAALAKAQAEAKAAEQARQQAEREAALKRAEEARQKQLTDGTALAKAQAEAKAAEQVRQQAEREATLKREQEARQEALAEGARKQEAACKDEQERLNTLQAAGKKAKDDLKQLAQQLTCERLRPLVTAALDKASASDVNTPDQVRAAQQQLTVLGCFSGTVDGSLNDDTKTAIQHYQAARGKPTGDLQINDAFISELKSQSTRVCPLVCPTGKIAKGEQCVVAEQPKPVAKHEDEDSAKRRHATQEQEKPASRKPAAKHEDVRPVRPAVTQQAATYSSGGGGGGGGHSTAIGVGF